MRIKPFLPLAVIAFATSCSTTPEALENSAGKVSASRNFSENYQEIYRRIYEPASRCQSGNVSAYASFDVNAQLYTELGYGDITMSLSNFGTRNYYWKAKVERAGKGSKLTVYSGNTMGKQMMMNKVLRWASGDSKC